MGSDIRPYQCEFKVRYTKMSEAAKIARRTRQSTEDCILPYYCRLCNGFHVGGQEVLGMKRPLSVRGETDVCEE